MQRRDRKIIFVPIINNKIYPTPPLRKGEEINNKQIMKQKIKNGFTLVELIVVITIIAVISTIALVSFGGTNRKARDARRMSDLQKIAIALEMARQVNSTYPATIDSLTPNFLQTLPTDPKGYSYVYALTDAYHYVLSGYMEDLGSTNMAPSGTCGAPGNCNYKITNP